VAIIGATHVTALSRGVAHPILSLFKDGTDGFWYNSTELFQTTDETTPADTVGDAIGRANDQSGNANNATQSTAGARPTLQSGPLMRFDGVDDNLLTTLVPSTAMTFLIKATMPASLASERALVGGSAGATNRCYLSIAATTGLLRGGVGSHDGGTITGGASQFGETVVAGLRFDGTTVTLFASGAEIYSGAQSGSPGADALRIAAVNNGGTASSFLPGDIYHAIAIKKALTASEIGRTSNWLTNN
jgi:hypothetical protein